MSAVFVTSSGTGIGKTLVAAAIVDQLRRAGRAPQALKPVASGFDPEAVEECDAAILLAAQGADVTEAAVAQTSPWRFAAPLSPHLAAEAEGRAIDVAALCGFCRTAIAEARAAGQTLVIEGIGGVMVPLTRRLTVLDWIAALSIPAVLVVGSYLGALSHALSAAAILTARGIGLTAVIVSESAHSAGLEATTATLGDFLPGARIIAVPRIAAAAPWRCAPVLAAHCLDAGDGTPTRPGAHDHRGGLHR